jgi:hypothetical protein
MTQTHLADSISADDANAAAPIALRPFLVSCAIYSIVGLTVLAGLAHALLSFWRPVV